MIQLKRIFVLTLLVAFTFNATLASAASGCMCGQSDGVTMEMPCHDAETANADQVDANDSDEEKTATCTMCKCGHCKSCLLYTSDAADE